MTGSQRCSEYYDDIDTLFSLLLMNMMVVVDNPADTGLPHQAHAARFLCPLQW